MSSIRKRGTKFQVQVRRKGQNPVTRSFHHRRDAEQWAREMEIEADRGSLKTNLRVLDQVTLGELVRRYRDTICPRKKGCEIETIVLNAFLRQPMCSKRVSELRTEDFARYRDHRLQKLKPASLKRQIDPLRHMFEVARDEWGLPIIENPLARLKFPTINNRRERRLKDGEEEPLLEAARECRNPNVLPIIQIALETAMRRGEILAMRWDHFDFKRRSLLIPKAKNGYSRTIPLTPKAYELMQSFRREEKGRELIFPMSANALRLSWERLKKGLGLRSFTSTTLGTKPLVDSSRWA